METSALSAWSSVVPGSACLPLWLDSADDDERLREWEPARVVLGLDSVDPATSGEISTGRLVCSGFSCGGSAAELDELGFGRAEVGSSMLAVNTVLYTMSIGTFNAQRPCCPGQRVSVESQSEVQECRGGKMTTRADSANLQRTELRRRLPGG